MHTPAVRVKAAFLCVTADLKSLRGCFRLPKYETLPGADSRSRERKAALMRVT